MEAPDYLAFDPGEMLGWAAFNEQGRLFRAGQVSWLDLDDFLLTIPTDKLKHIILEEYKVFAKYAKKHTGSKLETSQSIGKIKFWAKMHSVPVAEQPASILSIAEKWMQIKMPSDHSVSHQVSATLHGFYWLVRAGIAKIALESEHASRQENREAT